MNKLQFPAVAFLAVMVMSGCGSSSKSSTGSNNKPPSPTPSYVNLQFVQLFNQATQKSGCTLFGQDENASPKQYTYANLANDVKVHINNADGTIKTGLAVSSSGLLRLDKNQVPAGGFVTIIDSPSDADPYYRALSIQKDLIGNHVINVGRNQGSVSCYTANKAPTNDKSGYASVGKVGLTVTDYEYDSILKSSGKINSDAFETEAQNAESVLVRAYNNADLVGYAMVDNLTTNAFDDVKQIEALTETISGSVLTTGHTLSSININLHKSPYNYLWESPSVSSTSFNINSNSDLTFNYRASGRTSTNWNFSVNGIVGSSLDIQIPSSLSLNDTSPVIQQDSVGYSFVNGGVSTSGKTFITRSSYEKTHSSGSTLSHVVYSNSTDGNAKIPELNLPNLDPSSATNLETTLFEVSSINSNFVRFAMTDTGKSDVVRELRLPNQLADEKNTLSHSIYTKVSR
ncbi:conserved exported hypothetical protein [Vibrio nigripulchritudo SOn1]|uniref:Flagellar sheath protein A n=1 Tax=Vibrio nigripulchritudo SOn1 TaxID=1238450 RepID=A0AAV2VZ67_9VIBR|nr:hypothetical protein [Vibrio nigripulchritudo]CCO49993.1 conserved exported hypothetical protein [Vibrio nigripulchritudo SOn1]